MTEAATGLEEVKVLVGQEQREFTLNKKLLCETSSFFRDHVESSTPTENGQDDEEDSIMWLPAESAEMFELFVLWLYRRRAFLALVDYAVPRVTRDASVFATLPKLQTLRWKLVRLHLFAAVIDLPALQDVAMDALQDLYLRCDFDVSPHFVAFLYGDCNTEHAFRLRKWAVAMLAWTLHGVERNPAVATQFERLFTAYPSLADDYKIHLEKMALSKADVRIKNPQLRLPMNKLRSGERFFGFRQCSFHSHRATVGEKVCPHLVEHSLSPLVLRSPRAGKDKDKDAGSDGSDSEQTILSPVGEMTETSFLDLS
ncbi:hypothetical protein B0T25DRAFT_442223 [Lasiosphaeria hispida]|uniref:BTB domain-containing protein n=1 Tax=Lasiosphaeria hispida TaxID=260671 RepID=A0AAJ0MIY9_9PEZI|nr:hypothetical protein B0T25DRAFT_464888 [Lasiosphaeria hispida]KAK3362206.1 hypothetical protein B0T25DRAFT_442223 [Lasiosphaeria hispida]